MNSNFFKRIDELLRLAERFNEDVKYLVNNHTAYEDYLSPRDYQLLEYAVLNYYKPLPINVFEGLSRPDEKVSDVVNFLKIIAVELKQKIAPFLHLFSGACVPDDCAAIKKAVVPAQRKNSDLPDLENGLAAPFQTVTRYKLILSDLKKESAKEDARIQKEVNECLAIASDITVTMNETIQGIEKIQALFETKSKPFLDNTDLAKGVLMQKVHKDVNHLIDELADLINQTEDPSKKRELVEWLLQHFIPHIYKVGADDIEEKSKYLELMLTTIERVFSRGQLNVLTDIINEMNSELPATIQTTEEIRYVAEKLGLKYAAPGYKNLSFINFRAQLLSPFDSGEKEEGETKYPVLSELVLLIQLTHQLEDTQLLREEAKAEKDRLAKDVQSIAFDAEGRGLLNIAKPEHSDFSSAENARYQAHQRVTELIHTIALLDGDIDSLKVAVANLEKKKQNLADLHAKRSYKREFPLHAAVQQGNIAEVVRLLTSDKAGEYNTLDGAGFSPIYHAYDQGHTQIFQLLYEGVGPTEEEKNYYKELIVNTYKQLKNKSDKGKINEDELVAIENFREMAMLFKDPYHKLWNNIDSVAQAHEASDAQRVINVLQDYCSPTCLSMLNNQWMQLFLTKHMGRHSVNIKMAENLIDTFKNFLTPRTAPDEQLINRKNWSLKRGLKILIEAKENHSLLSIYKSEGSFSRRLTYMINQLELLTVRHTLPHSQSADNLRDQIGQASSHASEMGSGSSRVRLGVFGRSYTQAPESKNEEQDAHCIIS